jgi:hypothetical protein
MSDYPEKESVQHYAWRVALARVAGVPLEQPTIPVAPVGVVHKLPQFVKKVTGEIVKVDSTYWRARREAARRKRMERSSCS